MTTATIRAPATSAPPVCWCGAEDWQALARGRKFRVLQCRRCATSRIDPPPLDSDSQSEEFYTDYYQQIDAEQFAPPPPGKTRTSGFWRVADRCPAVEQVSGRVLDFGCGDGTLCHELQQHGWPEVYGVDVSRTRVERAARRYPKIRFSTRLRPGVEAEAGSFDLVILEAVVEHFPQPLATIRELAELLRPGGLMALTTPNMDSGAFRFLRGRWTGMLAPHAHIFLFGHASLARLLADGGLADVETGSYHAPWYTPADCAGRICRGQLKSAAWRAHQELGNFYGRLVGQGPMLYAVARKPQPSAAEAR